MWVFYISIAGSMYVLGHELDLRISSVVKSKGYQIRVDYGMRKNEDEISE